MLVSAATLLLVTCIHALAMLDWNACLQEALRMQERQEMLRKEEEEQGEENDEEGGGGNVDNKSVGKAGTPR